MRNLKIFALCLTAACTGACRQRVHSIPELRAYIADPGNGLRQIRHLDAADISLQYYPYGPLTGRSRAPYLQNKYYFVLGLSRQKKELLQQLPYAQYSEMVQVLSFRMKDYVSLIPENGKTVAPLDCAFQQTYGMSGENDLMLVFDRRQVENAGHFRLAVKEFGLRTGDLIFNMDTQTIKNIPTID